MIWFKLAAEMGIAQWSGGQRGQKRRIGLVLGEFDDDLYQAKDFCFFRAALILWQKEGRDRG